MAEKALKYLSARIGTQWYGVEVEKVIEVLHLVAFTEAPALEHDVLGLITVRDEVMPLIDLRLRFKLQDASLKLDTPVVAIRESHGPIALIFDDTDRVEEIMESRIIVSQESRQFPYITSVAKQKGHLLLLLDTGRISKDMQNVSVPFLT